MTIVEEADGILFEVLPDVVVLNEESSTNEAAVEGLDDKGPEADLEVVSVKDLVDFLKFCQQIFVFIRFSCKEKLTLWHVCSCCWSRTHLS